ncbi:DUF937 domain-containing protein [Gordonia sp. CPCC 206044]|uniref:DUF937 domain-containing protein n=1 Tax=Gordonia sp. CPCC 206044 TaxID=3140793 RepID=UPI003AF3823C
MSDIDELLSRLPIGDIASQLGVDEATARSAVSQTLPALVGGLQEQTKDDDTASGLINALSQHDNDLAAGDINLSDVDTADGSKIVTKMFGSQTDQLSNQLSEQVPAAAVTPGLIQKLLPILAPIVLSYVTSKILGGKAGADANAGDAASGQSRSGGLGDLGSILGGVLGGGGGAAGGLGSILGGILGR